MPEICRFFGIIIRFFYDDHLPPHFHVEYSGYKAQVAIQSMTILHGKLPPTALKLVAEWATAHKRELMDNWNRARSGAPLLPVEPLE